MTKKSNKKNHREIEKKSPDVPLSELEKNMTPEQWDRFFNGSERFGNGDKDINFPQKP